MNYEFSNKVVLVTGGSAGIGEAIALMFAKYGATLAIVGRNEEKLLDVAKKCKEEKGIQALAIVADLGTDDGCKKTVDAVLERFKRLDILVNNAGIGAASKLENADMEMFDKIFAINVRGIYNLTRLLAPTIIESKGNIVNVSSIVGTAVTVGSLPYSMSKAALDHFSRCIALELAPKGVRVNTVSPGITDTAFLQRATGWSDEVCEEMRIGAEKMIPMGKVCHVDDIARMVVHVASDVSGLVTGALIQVDGCLQFNYFSSMK